MNPLVEALKRVLADTFTFYLKAHNFHWNVVGPDFSQYHELFAKIYEEVYGNVDSIAEMIRTLDDIAPGSLQRFKQLTTVEESDGVPTDPRSMCSNLLIANTTVIASLYIAFKAAEDAAEIGIANALQDRILAHQKHAWFLKASMK